MGLSLQLRMERHCSVCDQIMDSKEHEEDAIDVALFGAVQYAICCCCFQTVRNFYKKPYRQKWNAWMERSNNGKEILSG